MIFRKASLEDIESIGELIEMARKSLRDDGIDQWQKTNPNEDIIREQIEKDDAYVFDKEGKVLAYAYVFDGVDPCYNIHEGKFKSDSYLVIHTLMVDNRGVVPKLGTKFMEALVDFTEKSGKEAIRIDTHQDNFRMRGLLDKFSFEEIGIVQIDEDGIPKDRICYEKVL